MGVLLYTGVLDTSLLTEGKECLLACLQGLSSFLRSSEDLEFDL